MSQKYSFTKIPYSFLEDEINITPDELYLYLKLTMWKLSMSDMAYINIDLISQDICFYSKINDNKNKIKKLIIDMNKKKFIDIGKIEKVKNNTLLKIQFPLLNINKQFVIIEFSEYEKFDNPNEFFIYTYIKKWGKLQCKKSFSEWVNLLKVKSDRTVKDLLYKMNTENVINIDSGNYTIVEDGKYRQEINAYSVTEEGKESVKHMIRENRDHNWYNNEFKTVNDFVVYLTTDDQELKDAAEKVIMRISSKPKGKKEMDKLREQAEIKILNKQSQFDKKQLENMMSINNLPILKTNKEEFCIFRDTDDFNINEVIGVYYIKQRLEYIDGAEREVYEGIDLYKFKNIDVNKYEDQIREFLRDKDYIYTKDILELKKKVTPFYSLE